jgi:hypothetical protein
MVRENDVWLEVMTVSCGSVRLIHVGDVCRQEATLYYAMDFNAVSRGDPLLSREARHDRPHLVPACGELHRSGLDNARRPPVKVRKPLICRDEDSHTWDDDRISAPVHHHQLRTQT